MKTRGAADAFDVVLGARIRARRLQLGLSQSALGKALGLSFQQIQKFERGANRISTGAVVLIAETLAIPLHQLLPGPETPPIHGLAHSLAQEQHGAALTEAWGRLTRQQRDDLAMTVLALAQKNADHGR